MLGLVHTAAAPLSRRRCLILAALVPLFAVVPALGWLDALFRAPGPWQLPFPANRWLVHDPGSLGRYLVALGLMSGNGIAVAWALVLALLQRRWFPGDANLRWLVWALPLVAVELGSLWAVALADQHGSDEPGLFLMFVCAPTLLAVFGLVGWAAFRLESLTVGIALVAGFAGLNLAAQLRYSPLDRDPVEPGFIVASVLIGLALFVALGVWGVTQDQRDRALAARAALVTGPPTGLSPGARAAAIRHE